MVVGLTTTYTISTYQHECCEFESHSWRGVLDTTLLCVSEFRKVGAFLWTLTADRYDIAELLSKVTLSISTITLMIVFYAIIYISAHVLIRGILMLRSSTPRMKSSYYLVFIHCTVYCTCYFVLVLANCHK